MTRRPLAFLLALLALVPLPTLAQDFVTAARAAILMDYRTGRVLFAKDPDEPLPPASMSKLMTARVIFEDLAKGDLALDQELPVSEKAWRMGGSRMFLDVNTRVKVADLLRGVIVQSGNDACIVLAEGLAGSEAAFAERMNVRAKELGLQNSHFANVTGWPDPGQLMSVRDLALLARSIIRDFPEHYELYSEREFEYNGIKQYNRNPLLRAGVPGVDGMKTGYTDDAGYGLVASAERGGQRLVMVITGLDSPKARGVEGQKLLEYGFRTFKEYRLFEPGKPVAEVPVWLGERATVPLVGEDPISVTLPRAARDGLKATVAFEAPVPAPIGAGQRLGRILVTAPGMEDMEIPLVAGEAVPRAGIVGRMTSALSYLVWGGGGNIAPAGAEPATASAR